MTLECLVKRTVVCIHLLAWSRSPLSGRHQKRLIMGDTVLRVTCGASASCSGRPSAWGSAPTLEWQTSRPGNRWKEDTGCQPLSTAQRTYLKSWWSAGIINPKTAPSSVNFRKSSRPSRRRSRSGGAAWTRPLLPQSNPVLLVNHECIPCCVQPSSKVTFLLTVF